jgi:PEGA domain
LHLVLMAQSDPHQSGIASKSQTKDSKDVTVQGCVAISFGDYVLVRTDPGNTYELAQGSRKIKLGPHLGEHVEVTGWERPSLNTSSDIFGRTGSPSSVTFVVTSIRTIEKRCTATGEAGASPVAAPDSGTQLRISSTPSDADIEIDGNFVGNTPSTVGVVAGQHQLVVKKSGYKPWEKKIVSSGQVKVDAVLEAESK